MHHGVIAGRVLRLVHWFCNKVVPAVLYLFGTDVDVSHGRTRSLQEPA